jgi:hypothetical protein
MSISAAAVVRRPGLQRYGPAAAVRVGTVETRAFMSAWSEAGEHVRT